MKIKQMKCKCGKEADYSRSKLTHKWVCLSCYGEKAISNAQKKFKKKIKPRQYWRGQTE